MREKQPRSVMQPIGDDWVVTMEWPDGVENGGPARLVIEPIGKMPVGGLSSTVLRHIDFRDAIERFREQIDASDRRTREYQAIQKFERERLRSALSKGVTDEYLALLSSEYVRAVDRGQAKINDYLAELVDIPTSTLRGHLWQARTRKLLTGTPGRKGGRLTPEAENLLEPYAEEWMAALEKVSRPVGAADNG